VAVLAGLRGGDLEDLAGLGFEYCVTSFFDSGGLAGEGERGSCVTRCLEVVSWGALVEGVDVPRRRIACLR